MRAALFLRKPAAGQVALAARACRRYNSEEIGERGRDHGGDRTVRAVSQRAHPSGEYPVLPALVAQRPAEGRAGDPADRGPGHRPLPPALWRADDPGHPLAGLGLGRGARKGRPRRPLCAEPADGAVPGRSGAAGGPGAGLPVLLHPGGAPCGQRPSPGGWAGHLPRHLPGSDRGTGGRTGVPQRPSSGAAAAGPCGCHYRLHGWTHGPLQRGSRPGLRGFPAAPVRRDVRLSAGGGGG